MWYLNPSMCSRRIRHAVARTSSSTQGVHTTFDGEDCRFRGEAVQHQGWDYGRLTAHLKGEPPQRGKQAAAHSSENDRSATSPVPTHRVQTFNNR